MAVEQEIKMVVTGTQQLDFEILRQLSEIQIQHHVIHHVSNTYYDTPDWQLRRQQVGLRMRQYDHQWYQTVKTSGTAIAGLHQRHEWEYPLSGPHWDYETLKQTPLRTLMEQDPQLTHLIPLFTTDFVRESYLLETIDGTTLELAYDHGKVTTSQASQPIHEIELELVSGHVTAMTRLARQLALHFPLQADNGSKAQMGYRLLESSEQPANKRK